MKFSKDVLCTFVQPSPVIVQPRLTRLSLASYSWASMWLNMLSNSLARFALDPGKVLPDPKSEIALKVACVPISGYIECQTISIPHGRHCFINSCLVCPLPSVIIDCMSDEDTTVALASCNSSFSDVRFLTF